MRAVRISIVQGLLGLLQIVVYLRLPWLSLRREGPFDPVQSLFRCADQIRRLMLGSFLPMALSPVVNWPMASCRPAGCRCGGGVACAEADAARA